MARVASAVAFMALLLVSLGLGAIAADCLCSCCLGVNCGALGNLEYVGAVPVESCSSCDSVTCYNNYPSECPSPYESGTVGVSCSDDSSTGNQVHGKVCTTPPPACATGAPAAVLRAP